MVPVIEDGKTITYTVVYVSGNFTFPYQLYSMTANTLPLINPVTVYTGDNTSVFRAIADEVNTYISPNSDKITSNMSIDSSGGLVATLTFKYTDDMSPLAFATDSFTSGIIVTYSSTVEEDIEESPYCLTNTQLLSVLGKIDEICKCGC